MTLAICLFMGSKVCKRAMHAWTSSKKWNALDPVRPKQIGHLRRRLQGRAAHYYFYSALITPHKTYFYVLLHCWGLRFNDTSHKVSTTAARRGAHFYGETREIITRTPHVTPKWLARWLAGWFSLYCAIIKWTKSSSTGDLRVFASRCAGTFAAAA